MLAARNVIKTPFVVINADDYYGKEGFRAVHKYLVSGGQACMAGFVLRNTLSDNGGVSRGICKVDEDSFLTDVVETKNIVRAGEGVQSGDRAIDVESLVSMNMWGLVPEFMDELERRFGDFFEKELPADPLKAEYMLPKVIGDLLKEGMMTVKVLRSEDTWYGMTCREDVAAVRESFREMIERGEYGEELF